MNHIKSSATTSLCCFLQLLDALAFGSIEPRRRTRPVGYDGLLSSLTRRASAAYAVLVDRAAFSL